MNSYSNPFSRALLKNDEIKRDVIRKQVHSACIRHGLITQIDIDTNSEQAAWVDDIIIKHLICDGLLKQLIFKNAEANDTCELLKTIVRDIVKRLLDNSLPFPKRR
ncbi:hypothetical protein [Vibrio sp.]|uniref:hypothetical protein n=1 Tax=Vibrio sp. TaxID=678 RepID=UPI003F6A7B57